MDRQEVERAYRSHGFAVYRRALHLLKSEEEAKEVLQEVFETALSNGRSFRRDCATMTWLYAITTNRCLTRLRSNKRRSRLMEGFDASSWTVEQPHPELRTIVGNLLASVPPDMAAAAVHYWFDDMTHQEIAEVMDCSRRKVGYLLEDFRARIAAGEAEAS